MNPWKEIVLTAHDLLNETAGTPETSKPLVVRITSMLLELVHAHEHAQKLEGSLTLANRQLERQAETIRRLQPQPQPESETPPPMTNDQFNAAVIKEVKRRSRVKRKKRSDEGL